MNEIKPIRTTRYDLLPVTVYRDTREVGLAAAYDARRHIQAAAANGVANVILATGNSQLTFLEALRALPGIEWDRVNIFHMDEYLGLEAGHPASFPTFLRRHFINFVNPRAFFPIPGDRADVAQVCRHYESLLRRHPADLVALGWGENGHLAFNDPPYALFDDPVWVKVVELTEKSRLQQVGEGHFPALSAVPREAITLTIPALLAARHILCIVPEERKAPAVRACLEEPISQQRPGSILRQVGNAKLYLDLQSASQLSPQPAGR